jgi:predicted phosphodiesterase
MTDLHYLSPSLASKGEALDAYEEAAGRRVADLHEVLDTVLDSLMKEEIEVLLVPGDLTNHGERQSHIDLKKKLCPLLEKGIRVFVIPGNHDINIPNAKAYTGEKPAPTATISPKEFTELYAPFGYADALERDEASLSYLAELNDTTWLLCFDTNRYDEHTTVPITGGRLRPETLKWALRLLDKAKAGGITVLGMMHHGLVEHMPYQSAFFPQYLVQEWESMADELANAGLRVVFTGHFHANDVTRRISPEGHAIYDVETASLAQYPFAYRVMELGDDRLSIDTRFVTSVPGNPNLAEEYREKMEKMARRVAVNRLKGLGIPMPGETLEALAEVIARLSVMHARGDEQPDEEMRKAIRAFAGLLGGEADLDLFTFDFPPEDNRPVIDLKRTR